MPGKFGFAVASATISSACLAPSANAALLPYRFDVYAQTGNTYNSLNVPALNDGGVVAFAGSEAGGTGPGVYVGNQFGLQRVPYNGPAGISWPVVDINNAGQVAFAGYLPRAPGDIYNTATVIRSDGGGFTTIGSAYSAVQDLSGGPVINNSGLVAFTKNGTIISDVTASDGAGRNFQPLTTAGTASAPRMNNADRVAAISFTSGGNYLMYNGQTVIASNLFLPQNGTTFTDPDYGTTGMFQQLREFDVGDNDRVVVAARWNDQVDAFYLWQNGTLSKVAGTDGLVGTPAINDLGVVAGLVTGNGPTRLSIFQSGVEGTIISVGSPFDGSTIAGLNFSPEGFNNNNQVAFLATLADGRTVGVISGLPEPGAASLLVGCGALMLRRRSKVYRT
jgi:hypothetical protein